MEWLFVAVAFTGGVALVTQAGLNTELARHLAGVVNTATVSLCVSAVAILILRKAFTAEFPLASAWAKAPWWSWGGGLLGAVYVTCAVLAAGRIGATALVAALLCGQLTSALVLDHFAAFGYGENPITVQRVIGVLLILAGSALVFLRRL